MDLSKEYIKMCEMAKELQKTHLGEGRTTWNEGEPYYYIWEKNNYMECSNCGKQLDSKFCPDCGYPAIKTDKGTISFGGTSYNALKNYPERLVIIFRQDQLQDMIHDDKGVGEWFVYYLSNLPHLLIIDEVKHNQLNPKYNSLEQMWLAIVMRENYNKIWNGEDWEEINA